MRKTLQIADRQVTIIMPTVLHDKAISADLKAALGTDADTRLEAAIPAFLKLCKSVFSYFPTMKQGSAFLKATPAQLQRGYIHSILYTDDKPIAAMLSYPLEAPDKAGRWLWILKAMTLKEYATYRLRFGIGIIGTLEIDALMSRVKQKVDERLKAIQDKRKGDK